jgi:chromosome segregation ATPase
LEVSQAERKKLEATLTHELHSTQASLQHELKSLNETLASETRRRESLEHLAGEIGQRRNELEAQLTAFRQELEASQNQCRAQQENSWLQQSRSEARTRDLQTAQIELQQQIKQLSDGLAEETKRRETAEKQVNGNSEQQRALQAEQLKNTFAIQQLEAELQDRKGEVVRLKSLLQSESAQRRQEQSQAQALESHAAKLNEQLGNKVAQEQKWQERQAELEQCNRRQKEQLAHSAAAAIAQEVELNSLRITLDDMRVIQSALCARVRDLTVQQEKASKRVRELENQSLREDSTSKEAVTNAP